MKKKSIAGLPTTQWRLSRISKDTWDKLAMDLGVHPIVSQILASRDILTSEDGARYLTPSLKDLHNPFLMKDMEKGVHRLAKAIYNREKIMIYGDYDADGITSVVVLLKFLRELTSTVDYYIPDRLTEGYSLNIAAVERMKAEGVSLLITVDCGISDYDQITHAQTLGIDTIILDHHEVSGTVPDAVAAINPHQADCQFPFKHLAAVGIVFNFLIAFRGTLRKEGFWNGKTYPNLKEYLDLVALGTIGDIVPLIDENRIFAKIGLGIITEERRVGLKALKEICGIDSQSVDAAKASYNLIPRINAPGRIASPQDAVQLLMTDDLEEARQIARKLDTHNRKRQDIEKAILKEIIDDIEGSMSHEKGHVFVYASANWHPGVIGIVASRLVDRYYRPSILISLKDGIGKGSGRSIADFDIYQGLKKCDSLLLSYGGHRYAAGISIREEDVAHFAHLLEEIVKTDTKESDFVSQTVIDAQCDLKDINHSLLTEIDRLAPFGTCNPEPVLCVRNVNIASPAVVGNNHLRMRINSDGISCNSIWFSKGHYVQAISGSPVDIVFTPQINNWNGSSDIQLKMRDIALPSGS
jgi:single-stranded-DNA-specific exonuclease